MCVSVILTSRSHLAESNCAKDRLFGECQGMVVLDDAGSQPVWSDGTVQ